MIKHFEFRADLNADEVELFKTELEMLCEDHKVSWVDRTDSKEESEYHSDAPFFDMGIRFKALARSMMNRNTTVEELIEKASDAGMEIIIGVSSNKKGE